jgi:hypothetical protein
MDYDLVIIYNLGAKNLYEYILAVVKSVNLEIIELYESENFYDIICKYVTIMIDKDGLDYSFLYEEDGVNVDTCIEFLMISRESYAGILDLFKILAGLDTDIMLFNEGIVGIVKRIKGKVTVNNYEEYKYNYFYPFEELGCEYEIETSE